MKLKNLLFRVVLVCLFSSLFTVQRSNAQYCTPNFLAGCTLPIIGTDADDVNTFILAGDAIPINDINTGCSGGYDDRTGEIVTLTQGNTYTATVNSQATGDNVVVFIDFDDNFTFDASEIVGGIDGIAATPATTDFSITIPIGANPGTHRMRVIVNGNFTYSSISPCPNPFQYSLGEAHDYTVIIQSGVISLCDPVTDLSVDGLSDVTANVYWDPSLTDPSPVTYDITIDQSSLDPIVTDLVSNYSSTSVTGLTAGTTYYAHVRIDCGGGSYSIWMTIPFSTGVIASICPPITGLFATNVTSTGAEIDWDDIGGQYEYIVNTNSADPIVSGTLTSVASDIETTLSPGTIYYAHVRDNCLPSGYSTWATTSFLTQPQCNPVSNLGDNSVTQTGATITWDPTATNYEYVVDQLATDPAGAGTPTTATSEVETTLNPGTTYYAHVRVDCGNGNFSSWTTISFTTVSPCASVTGLGASNITETSADIGWNATATNYEYVIDQSGSDPAGAGTATTGNTYSASGLAAGSTNFAHVRVDCGGGIFSAWTTIQIVLLCDPVSNLGDNSVTQTGATITWDPTATNYEYVVDQLAIDPAGAGTATTSTSDVETTLTPGTTYYAHVRVDCGNGNFSAWTTISFPTVPICDPVTGAGSTGSTQTTIDFTWAATATNYEYVVDQNSGDPAGAGTPTTANSYTATGLTPATTYYLHVRVDCGGGNFSTWLNIGTSTTNFCAPVNNLAVNGVTDVSANVVWDPTATNYEYVIDNSNTDPAGAGTPTTATNVAATGLTPATTYYAHVRVECSPGDFSVWMTVPFTTDALTPTCLPVTGLVASGITTTGATITWDPMGINYEYVVDNSSSDPAGAGTPTTALSDVESSLTPGTVYYAHVRVDCGGGDFSVWVTISFITPPLCNPVTTLAANSVTQTGATITWDPTATNYEYVVDQLVTDPAGAGTPTTASSDVETTLIPGTIYYAHVRVDCGGGNFSSWVTTTFTTIPPCDPVSNLGLSGVTTTGFTAGWDPTATNYEYVLDQVFTDPVTGGTATTATSIPFTGLIPGTNYYVHVRVDCGGGNFSAWVTVGTSTIGPCNPVTNLATSNITQTGVTISWDPASTNYEYVIDQNAADPAGAGTATTASGLNIPGLTAGTVYYVHVRVDCGGGNFSTWVTLMFTTLIDCNPVAAVNVGSITQTSAAVSWGAVPGATTYEWLVDNIPGSPAGAGVTTGATSVPVSGLTPGTVYYAHVRVDCGGGNNSGWVTVPFTTLPPCDPVTNLAVTNITQTTATASWDASSGGTGYEYVVNTTAADPTGAGTFTTATSVPLTGLTSGTTYYVHVRLDCGSGSNSAWVTLSFTTYTPCSTVSGFTASGITQTGATISWNAIGGVTGYDYVVDQSAANPAGGGTFTTLTSIPLSGLLPGTLYYAHVRVDCGGGNYSAWITISFTTLDAACNTVTNLSASAITQSSATISWTAVSGVAGYEYVVDMNAAAPGGSGTPTGATSEPITGLTAATTYYAHVRVICGGGVYSAWVTIPFTTLAPVAPCDPVTGLTATNVTGTDADISWSASTSVVWYEYVIDGSAADPAGAGLATTSTNVPLTSLDPGTTYYVHVRVNCGNGNYSPWVTISFTTWALGISTVGIDEDFSISGYPNPASDMITVKMTGQQKGNATLQVSDISGKIIEMIPVNGEKMGVDVHSLAAGQYFIRYVDNERVQTIRFIKQ